jgi:hypothetical protein
MTSQGEGSPPTEREGTPAEAPPIPLALRVSFGLCIAAGLIGLVLGVPTSIGLIGSSALSWLPLIVNTSAALLMCAAAFLSLRARKSSLVCVVLAYAIPTALNLIFGQGFHLPPIILFLAFITLAMNWHVLH